MCFSRCVPNSHLSFQKVNHSVAPNPGWFDLQDKAESIGGRIFQKILVWIIPDSSVTTKS